MSISKRPGILLFLVATLLALFVTAPAILSLNQVIYGTPGDAFGGVSQYWWWGYALTHGKPLLDNTMVGVPLGSDWPHIPFAVLPLIFFPAVSAAVGPVAGYNLLIISAFPLTAVAAYLLGREAGMRSLAAAFTGLAFAFVPYHVEKAQGHGNASHMEFLPLTLMFLLRWRRSGRRRDAALAGAMAGLQLWMDWSFEFVLAFGLLAFVVAGLLVPPAGWSRARWLGKTAVDSLVFTGVWLLFTPFALVAFHRPGSGSFGGEVANIHRQYADLVTYSAHLREYLEPWHANPLLPQAIRAWENAGLHGSNWTESSLFVGYIVLALALVGIAASRRSFNVALCVALVGAGTLMAQPPIVHLFGVEIHGPSFYIYPFLGIFRVYARFGVLVLVATAVLAGLGFSALQDRAGRGRRRWVLLAPFVLLALEFNNLPPPHVTRLLPAPAAYTWLRSQPDGVLLEYPAQSGNGSTLEIQVRLYGVYQMVHQHPMFLNGEPNSGPVANAARTLEPYYQPGVAARLRGYGIRYVFVHRDAYRDNGFDLPTAVTGLRFLRTMDGTDIYLVE